MLRGTSFYTATTQTTGSHVTAEQWNRLEFCQGTHYSYSLANATYHARKHKNAALPGIAMHAFCRGSLSRAFCSVGLPLCSQPETRKHVAHPSCSVGAGWKNWGTNKCTDSGTIQSHSDLQNERNIWYSRDHGHSKKAKKSWALYSTTKLQHLHYSSLCDPGQIPFSLNALNCLICETMIKKQTYPAEMFLWSNGKIYMEDLGPCLVSSMYSIRGSYFHRWFLLFLVSEKDTNLQDFR